MTNHALDVEQIVRSAKSTVFDLLTQGGGDAGRKQELLSELVREVMRFQREADAMLCEAEQERSAHLVNGSAEVHDAACRRCAAAIRLQGVRRG